MFDLPTEAQWEYACRAGTNTHLNNGKNITDNWGTCPELDEIAWYYKNASNTTHIVGQKKPNAWGICDMHGNVYELCRDYYGAYSDEEVKDSINSTKSSNIVIRGGYFHKNPGSCRSAYKNGNPLDDRFSGLGFRVALVPVD